MTSTVRWWFPMIGEKFGPAWRAAAEILRDGDWHEFDHLVEVMSGACDALPKSLAAMLRGGVEAGVLQQNTGADVVRAVRITPLAPFLLPELRDETFPVSIVSAVGIVDGDDGLWAQIAPLWDEAVKEIRAKQPESSVVPFRRPAKKAPARNVGVEPEGVEHPDGEKCDKCSKPLVYKIVTRARDGQRFRLWTCPSQQRRGDGHRSEFINDGQQNRGSSRSAR